MPSRSLTLFGIPTLLPADSEGGSAALGAKATALLAYLALERGPHSREKLASLLWGESPDAQARASLRQALRRLHAVLGDDLAANRDTVQLAAPLDCDVTRFLDLAARGDPAAAGFEVTRFLDGLAFTGAPALEDWADATRRSLLERWAGAVRAVARDAVLRSRWRDALAAGESWLAADPLNEEAIAVVMEAIHCLGDRAGALSRYRHYREALHRELGARPTATLTELAARIESASPGNADAAGPSSPRPAFVADLVGREAQWVELSSLWERLGQGTGGVAVLEGQAGSGKSRLASEFARWAIGRGATVLQGHGYEPASGAAFGPLASALATALNAPGLGGAAPEWLAEVARLVPDLRRRFPGIPAPTETRTGEQSRLFEGVAQVLLALAAERAVIVWLDDVQWCDAESCAMLLYLTERLEHAPVLFLASATTGSRRRNLPGDHLLRQLSARRQATFISLDPLSEDEVWAAIRQMGNIHTPTGARRFARRIHQVSGGNPFYVIELLKTLFSQGLLSVAPISGEWIVPADIHLGSSTALPMPRSLRDAIGERVTLLDEEAHLLLGTLAVAARPVGADVLAHVHGMSRLRIAAMADDLAERLLAVEENGAYRVIHPVLGDVVRSSLTASLRRELHRALSLSIEVVTPADRMGDAAGEIAWHAEHAGDAQRACTFALLAADSAAARTAFHEAFGWLGTAARAAPEEAAALAERAAELAGRAGWPTVPPFPSAVPPGVAITEEDMDLRTEASVS
jgi:DNA-binding SARP family transcriptional activator